MVNRYPDTITITSFPQAVQDGSGHFSIPTGESVFNSECRFQPAGANNVIRGDDGDEITYSHKVYMPPTDSTFEFGDTATGTIHDGSTFNGKVKGHHNRQTHTIVWV